MSAVPKKLSVLCDNSKEYLTSNHEEKKEDGSNYTYRDVCPFCVYFVGAHRSEKLTQPVSSSSSAAASAGLVPLSPNDPFLLFWNGLASDTVQLTTGELTGTNPPGQLMTLPVGANLFGLPQLGNKLYVRPCYSKLHSSITTYLDSDPRNTGALVTGNPGVGKSFFLVFLLHYYKQKGFTIVFEDQQAGLRHLLPPGGAVVQQGAAGSLDFIQELKFPSTIYLFDCGGKNKPEPTKCAARTIVVSSPDPAHYGDWVKSKQVFTMPVWSAEECTAVVPSIYKPRSRPDEYAALFKLYGGIARTLFGTLSWDTLNSQLNDAISGCNLPAVVGSIDRREKLTEATHKLLHYIVDESNYIVRTLNFATDYICEQIMQQKEQDHFNEVVSFLSCAAGKPDVAGVRGKVFELHAHSLLSQGNINFRVRWLSDAEHNDFEIAFQPSQQKGIVSDLKVLANHEYARLLKSNFPTIDAAVKPKHFFQMTVSPSHSINLVGLNQAITELGLIGQQCFLYFVVPPDIYPIFKNPSVVPAEQSLPNNVTLVVLELPLQRRLEPTDATAIVFTSSSSTTSAISSKRKRWSADKLVPPAKKPAIYHCNCTTGYKCICKKNGNKCGDNCHQKDVSSNVIACNNV